MVRADRGRADKDQREYEHPIPGRDEIIALMERVGRPLPLAELAGQCGISDEAHQRALENRLRAMVRDGQLIRNRASEYCLTGHLDLIAGKVIAHRDGFGFMKPDDGSDDLYLSAREMRPLFDGDRVAVRASETPRGREAHVVEVLSRALTFVVGQFYRERGIDYVLEEGDARTEVLIAKGARGGAEPGDIVKVEIIEYPLGRAHAIGRVAEVLGRPDRPGIETDVAMLTHGIPYEWPAGVLEAAEALPDHVTREARLGRVDLRDVALVTIDGADAKDFDDAVYCERDGDGFRLLVAIADVAHYVGEGSVFDREARVRATSVYFPDRVVPMLPEALSNGLCSLNPQVDRLCLCCEMRVSADGKVGSSRFFEAVMRSHARLTYEEAFEILESTAPKGRHGRLKPQLEDLRAVHALFDRARRQRGAIDFGLSATKIELDSRGQVRSVNPVERLLTHRIIEECMIAANVEAAKRLRKARIPTLYRCHDGPEAERLDELLLFLKTFDFSLPPRAGLKPADLSRIIERVSGGAEAELVETVILRSMKRAQYQPKNIGHFGLALEAYSHFTSPIRRYPDLLVHRALKWLATKGSSKGFAYTQADMEQLGDSCSRFERRADEAVWEVEERLKCVYMRKHVGDQFSVIVSGIAPFGLFVRVPELHVDGLIHVSSLPRDYYHRDASGTALTGERSGKRFRLMDPLEVRLTNVNLDDRKIDFALVDGEDSGDRAPRSGKPRSRRRRRVDGA